MLKSTIKKMLYRAGYGVCPADELSGSVRAKMIRNHGIQTVIDVGANVGGYGVELRDFGFSGRIISFEPTTEAYGKLVGLANHDPDWTVVKAAVGETNGEVTIHVAANDARSSSLLPMLKLHQECAPDAKYVSTEIVPLKTLDSAVNGMVSPDQKMLLKIDTQGYEHMVLRGASKVLPQVDLIECELSLVPLYDGQFLFLQMIELLKDLGFEPIRFAPGFIDAKTGHSLQLDAIFSKS
jgi:FkbM family methyltransferase